MKELLKVSIVIIVLLITVNWAFCQDPGEIDSLAFGNPDGSAIIVNIDQDIEVPIWLKCDENIAFVHFCLATENEYIPIRGVVYGIYPLDQWELFGTFPSDGWPEDGLTSSSLLGMSNFNLPQPNYINTNGEWWMLGAFRMHTTDDVSAIGQQSQLLPGEDPLQGLTIIFDEFWVPITPEMIFSSLEFVEIDTTPPEIVSPSDDTLITLNINQPCSVRVIAVDADDDDISLSVEFPFDYEFTEIESYPGYANYRFNWTPSEAIDTIVAARFIATDPTLQSDTINVNFKVNSAPEIVSPPEDTLFIVTNHCLFSVNVFALDLNNDEITLQVNFPYDDYEFTEIESYPGYANYLFSWTPLENPDSVFSASFIATDPDLLSDTISVNFEIRSLPEIIFPVDDTLIVINDHFSFSMQTEAIDEDGEDITLQVEFPYDDYEFTEIESYPGYISYLFNWTPPDDCDSVFQAIFIATDINLVSDTNMVNFKVKPVTVFVTNDTTLGGYPASIDVWLIIDGDNSNVGSFDLLFVWSADIVTPLDVEFTEVLSEWDYVNATIDPQGPGTLKLLGFANFLNGGVPPLKYGEYHLATLNFMTTYHPDFENIDVPLDMPVDILSNNVVTDSSGYIVYHPDIHEGRIVLISYDDILIGDINQNLFPYEAGDAITFIEHLADPIGSPFNLTQLLASDCNQDQVPETIADLIYLINVISNGGDSLRGGDNPGFADLTLNKNNISASLHIEAESPVGGVLIRISHNGATLSNIESDPDVELHYNDTGDILTAVVYRSESIQSLGNEVLRFSIVDGDSKNITIDSYEISDVNGRLFQIR